MKWFKLVVAIIYISILCFILSRFAIGIVLSCVFTLPIAFLIILALHEVSHFLFFVIFGYKIKQLRIGLIDIRFDARRANVKLCDKGMFYGCCTINDSGKKNKIKIILSLLVGGLSGLLNCVTGLILLFVDVIPYRWIGFVIAIVIAGIYSFCATLLIPTSGDRLQIKKIKEGSK